MLQHTLIGRSARFLRWYRTRLLLDWSRLTSLVPACGRVLDVGCGVGSIDYALARARPELSILGIDVSAESIALARRYHSLSNVQYACMRVEEVRERFDCVLFVDVFHHVPPGEQMSLLEAARRLLAPSGFALIKDTERRRGQVSWFMDRFVSGCKEIYLQDCDELVRRVSEHLEVIHAEARFRFPFPHCYIRANRGNDPGT